MRAANRGFTLVELLVTIVIGSVLMALAVPAFFNTIQANRVAAAANTLASGFAYARSEAVKRASNVSICPRDGDSITACGDAWNSGWLVFANPNNNANPAAAGDVLRVGDPLAPTLALSQSVNGVGAALITYQRMGDVLAPAGAFEFQITLRPEDCTSEAERQRTLDLTRVGRAQIRREACEG
jgi:type IV fimbrial biogenesis protein FimT